ncbi:MAG: tetratricopeptide repeat protein [Spirochaetaceae bacterium]|jgi:tetratricopeptide (TPR) repeat protein|nr:tetratricopeptide repeat protein [Spirochaetaceae bacterium]
MMDAVLAKAVRLARRRKFAAAIKLLEAEVLYSSDSWQFPYILGLCYLKSGDAGSAYPLLRRASEKDDRQNGPLLALAALHMRRGESVKAISLYLRVKDFDAGNRTARRGLKILEQSEGNLTAWQHEKKIAALYPAFPPVPVSPKAVALVLLVLALSALGLGAAVLVRRGVIRLPRIERTVRNGLEAASLTAEEKNTPAGTEGTFRYVLTSKEILDSFEKGRTLFNQGRDDAARVEMNRILESNAAAAVKNKARILITYMEDSDFTNLKDRFSYSEVEANPYLYRDCTVIWRGMAANLDEGDTATAFNLLVGFDTRTRLEGIVRVRFPFAVPVNLENSLEVLGRVVPVPNGSRTDIELTGVAIHEIKE